MVNELCGAGKSNKDLVVQLVCITGHLAKHVKSPVVSSDEIHRMLTHSIPGTKCGPSSPGFSS